MIIAEQQFPNSSIRVQDTKLNATESDERIRVLEKELEESKAAKLICIVILVILSIVYAVTVILWRCCSRKTKGDTVKKSHLKQRGELVQRLAKADSARIAKQIKIEGIDTNVGRWQPEKFRDLLGNSEMVQNVLVDDIVHDMQTEGYEGGDV